MPSFDTVSEVDMHEVTNAVDQAKRELTTRWDFRNVQASYELANETVTMTAEQEFQLEQMTDILRMTFVKRKVDSRCLNEETDSKLGKTVKRSYKLTQGIDQPTAKLIGKLVKESGSKVQVAIQGDKVRMTGKKRDELQEVMALLRESESIKIPLQFNNFRD
ncbi:MAG: YajQ family cyclic di-GMP-binding protein [Hahellaceae bacterium]|nr:YajQ family cyclic di-GMP-binding protein [Hahellaceae bacterium]